MIKNSNGNNFSVLKNITDCHTHILPSIDDGPSDADVSRQMIDSLLLQGAAAAILTPHFYPHETNINDFLFLRNESYKILTENLKTDLKLILGSEAFFCINFEHFDNIGSLCIEGTDLILFEIPFPDSMTAKILKQVEKFLSMHNYTPIIAHIDRYPFFNTKNIHILHEFIDMGCLLQMGTAPLKEKGTAKFAVNLVKEGLISFIGSDCHNIKYRTPDIADAYKVLTDKFGISETQKFIDNSNRILGVS